MNQTLDLCGPARLDSLGGRPATAAVSDKAVARAYSVAFRMTGNEADAEAATQQALLRLGRQLDAGSLYQFTVRAVVDLRRTRPTDRDEPVSGDAPSGHRLSRLEAAIAALPPAYRDPFVLADVEGMSAAAVGELLGVSVSVVKDQLHRARMLLCAALRDGR
ncbi:RNA polymerase sigma factor [Urbifossiella limnaea]|uniref:ECF RNA polymerase sigma factor SigE n=1 Tax=Urbifossiella limnaea TaxID=2528023 RepID=A0A517XQA1_9BACT|nr:sigma factor-like helix-turn-helix DNA-binding protein [Urbifossiella limnaea]QDU19672.1 ECF RNA polymerase sigma factor SigE [Urbifossiella limnaea]